MRNKKIYVVAIVATFGGLINPRYFHSADGAFAAARQLSEVSGWKYRAFAKCTHRRPRIVNPCPPAVEAEVHNAA